MEKEIKLDIKPKSKSTWWHYIILVGIILFITALIINSSAKTTYDYETQTYTIREGLGEDIATIQLINNSNFCLVDCYADIWIQPHINISLKDAITNLKFYNKQGKEINLRKSEITRNIEEEYTQEVFDKYEDVCEEEKIINNITEKTEIIEYPCNPIYKNETFKRDKKVEFALDSFLEEGEDYYIRINGKKNPGESVEWIMTFYGQELDAWEWWIDGTTHRYLLNVTDADSTNFPYGVNFTFNKDYLNCSLTATGSNMWIVNSTNGSTRWYNSTSFGTNTVIWFKHENVSNSNLTYSMYCGGGGTESSVIEGEIFGITNSTAFPDLVSSWHFDEGSGSNFIDYAGYYDANATNPAWGCQSPFTTATGKCINGSADNWYGLIHGSEYGTAKFTLVAWLWIPEGDNNDGETVFSRYHTERFAFNRDDNDLFRTCTGATCSVGTSYYNDSTWRNFVITYDGSAFKTYVDGIQAADLDWTQALGTDGVPTTIGVFSEGNIQSWEGLMDEMVWFNNTVNYEVYNISARNYAPIITMGQEEATASIQAILDAPDDAYVSTETNLTLQCNASALALILKNISINIWNQTERYYADVDDIGGTSNQSNWTLTSIPDEDYIWNCEVWDTTESYSSWGTTNRTFTIDTTAPTITIDIPTLNQEFFKYDSSSLNISLNYTVYDLNIDSCLYNFNGSNTTLSSCENTTFFSGEGLKNITVYGNDTAGSESNESSNFSVNYISNVSVSYNESAVETTPQTFTLFFNATNITNVNASLIYNNTDYNYTSKTINPTNATIISSIFIPQIDQENLNISFYWNYTLFGFNGSITNQTPLNYSQNVSQFRISFCNATYTQPTINFTFKDEGNLSSINGTIDIDFAYWYTDVSRNRTYNYSDSNKNNYTLCIYPSWASGNTNYDVYYSGDGYPQRRDVVISLTLTNISQDKFLYLLASAEGIYVRFVTVNSLNQPITFVDVLMEKDIGGTYTTIEREITDDAGLATFWVDPDDTYRFTFIKTDYETQITTLRPTSTEIYYVTMETGEEVEINESVWHGISYIIEVNTTDNILINDTDYRFNFNISSGDSNLQNYSMKIYNNSNVLLGSASGTTAAGGNISVDINTGNASSIYGKFFFTANYTTKEITRNWEIMYYEYKGDYSVMVFFEDFRNLTIGGFNTFTRLLICFIVIFIITCVLSYRAGVYSSKGIIGIVMVLVTIFSLVGFLTTDAALFPGSIKTQEFLAQYSVAFIVNIILASAIILWRPMEES